MTLERKYKYVKPFNIKPLWLLCKSSKSIEIADKKMQFVLTEGAKKYIAEKGFDPIHGARPLKRAIQKHIEDPIADEILKGKFSDGSTIQIKMKNKTELGFYEIDKKEDKPSDIQIDN